ncbi:hypothetical protein QIW49_03865 [Francisellaceae bacterium CB300]
MGNKLKALTAIMLGGLALASCTDKNDGEYSTRTSFTASASVGGVDLSLVTDYAIAAAAGVTLNGAKTVATFICPAGEVSFNTSNLLTCSNATGCDTTIIAVTYNDPLLAGNTWTIETTPVPQNQQEFFYADNNAFDGSQYLSGILCIPSAQVSYWS